MMKLKGRIGLFLLNLVFLSTFNSTDGKFTISFSPNDTVTIHIGEMETVEYTIDGLNLTDQVELLFTSADEDIATVQKNVFINPDTGQTQQLNVSGVFLGQTVITCINNKTGEIADGNLNVIVIRKKRVIDTLFTASVATLVAIIYINFGCAIDWNDFPKLLKRPVGPIIGFCGQFIMQPLISYGIGKVLFPDNPEMQLGFFFTGVSPAGGASNVWTVLLDGNMSLSIMMSAISTTAAFGMMPLWIFTLGRQIFEEGNLAVPYTQITTYVLALIVPLLIGFLIQRYLKKVATFMTRILKGFSSILILFIIIFAIVTNLYLFQLFSWQIIVGGMILPWAGYSIGYLVSRILRQPIPDCRTIAIEIGIANTGISIFLLRFALPQPQADLTTVAPVSVAILTPFPLLFLWIYKKIRERFGPKKEEFVTESKEEHISTDKSIVNDDLMKA